MDFQWKQKGADNMLSVMESNVRAALKSANGDHCECARIIDKHYKRGEYTLDEYENAMDILASIMLWEKR